MSLHQAWVIGSAASCDIVLDEPTISGRHCRVTRAVDGFTVEDLGSTNGTFVNGARIEGIEHFTSADEVTLGRTISLPWSQIDPESGRRTITIGRHPGNDVVLDCPDVSARHARLVIEGDRLTIEDLGSTTGTAVGAPDNRVQRARLAPDDTVYFGSLPVTAGQLLGNSPIQAAAGAAERTSANAPAMAIASCVGLFVLVAVVVVSGYYLSRNRWKTQPGGATVREAIETAVPSANEAVTTAPGHVSSPGRIGVPQSSPAVPATPITPGVESAPSNTALFWVTVGDTQDAETYRVGTAWAVAADRLITTASVLAAVRQLREDRFPHAQVYLPAAGQRAQIVSSRLHPRYEQAAARFRQVQQQYDDLLQDVQTRPEPPESLNQVKNKLVDLRQESLQLLEEQAYYDVGILRIDSALANPLQLADSGQRLLPKRKVQVLSLAFDNQDPYFDPTVVAAPTLLPSRIQRLVRLDPQNEDPQRLLVDGDSQQLELNLIGSPLLDTSGQVVGMYVRATPSPELGQPPAGDTFDAVLTDPIRELLALGD